MKEWLICAQQPRSKRIYCKGQVTAEGLSIKYMRVWVGCLDIYIVLYVDLSIDPSIY